jgi:hypothetical protein
VQQQHGDRHAQPEHGGDQRLGNTAGHEARIAGTEQGDGLESHDHAGHRTQQTHQGRHGGNDLEQRQVLVDTRHFLEHRLAEAQFQGLDIELPFFACRPDDAPHGVIVADIAHVLQLPTDHHAIARSQDDQAPHRQQDTPEYAQGDDGVADRAALGDALAQVRCLGEDLQQLAAHRVDGEGNHRILTARRLPSGRRGNVRCRLARELHQPLRLGDELQVLAIA